MRVLSRVVEVGGERFRVADMPFNPQLVKVPYTSGTRLPPLPSPSHSSAEHSSTAQYVLCGHQWTLSGDTTG